MIQGSPEWFDCHKGALTGSRIYEACAKNKKGEYYASRDNLLYEKLIERLTGESATHYVNDAMQWGLMYEKDARSVYETEQLKGMFVQECGFFPHPSIAHSGASPDGLVGEDGVIEIKCPTTRVHLNTLLSGIIPEEHTYQMCYEVESTERIWADFISYDPRLLPASQALAFFCKRYEPPLEFRKYIREEAIKFLAELDKLEARVRSYHG